MIIEVKQKHIDEAKGFEGDSHYCPVARAVNDALNDNFYVDFNGSHINLEDDNAYLSIDIDMEVPSSVTRWASRFDDGLEVNPFVFEIENLESLL